MASAYQNVLSATLSTSWNGTNPVGVASTLLANCLNAATATVQISGTGSYTIQFEATLDGVSWFSVYGQVPGAAPATAAVSSATAAGEWQFSVSGWSAFRCRLSAVSGGATPTVNIGLADSVAFVQASVTNTVSDNLVKVGGSAIALGQAAMAASLPVAIATDQTAVPANITEVGGSALALGSTTASASLPAALASDDLAVVVLGAKTDAAVVTNATGSISAKLRGLVSLLASVAYDATNSLRVSVFGKGTAAGDTAIPSMDTVGHAGFQKVTDGTGTLGLDNSNTTAKVSLYVKTSSAADTVLTLGQAVAAASLPVVRATDQDVKQISLSFMSASSAGTVAQTAVTGLGPYRTMSVYAALTGPTGDVLDLYLQYSPDVGTTWTDFCHWTQIAAAAGTVYKVFSISKSAATTTITTTGHAATPALAAGTVLSVDWGDRVRVVAVSGASVSAGAAQVILATLTS